MEKQESLDRYIVILAGGGGTRLWPQSRQKRPKQFLKLFGDKTLLQTTFERVEPLVNPEHILVVTSGTFATKVREQLPKLPAENVLVEPVAAGTAAAVGLVVALLSKRHQNAVISTLASDHYITEQEKFLDYLSASQESALRGEHIVTMGLKPSYPHTGLGYIHAGAEKLNLGNHKVFEVRSFTEKPSEKDALAYLQSGDYYWNANINSYQLEVIEAAFEEHMPQLYRAIESAKNLKELKGKKFKELWSKLKPEAIDTGILEKAKNVLVLPAEFSWLDIGDWSVLHSFFTKEKGSNVVLGEKSGAVIEIDSKDTLISSPKLVGIVGVEDLVVVDTPDALLICKKSRAQDVKKIVEELRKKSLKSYL